jgi:hypothetical protein
MVSLPGDFSILDEGGQLFVGLAFDRRSAAAFGLLRREAEQVGTETSAA